MKKLITLVTVILTLQGVFAMDNTLTTKELAIVDLSAATARGNWLDSFTRIAAFRAP